MEHKHQCCGDRRYLCLGHCQFHSVGKAACQRKVSYSSVDAEYRNITKEQNMNLIDKYIAEVGKHLPRQQRRDIEAEIRSTLEDMLEERKQAQGTADDTMVIELLKEYGAPRKVAESYTGPRYLIGPRMYPIFELVTRIVVTVLFALAV